MGTNAVLDIAIGLVLMYLVLSLIGTVVNEIIATKLKLRASTLERAIGQILDNPTLRADFYNHGLVDGTHKALNGTHPSYLSGKTFAMALLGSLDPTKPLPGFADIKNAIENLPDCNIRDVLLAHLSDANGNLEALRSDMARYFDSAMDRVGGVYKRHLRLISLCVGLVLVVALNADTIAVGTALWNDASLRAQMVQDAKVMLTTDQGASPPGAKKVDVAMRLSKLETEIRPLPIWWPDKAFKALHLASWWDLFSLGGIAWFLTKLFGLVLSALAISLGAPFWFDMLSKFMNVRGSGPKPGRTATS